jgi:hypothetical protein
MLQPRTRGSETCPQRQVYECKPAPVRGHMFKNYLTASTKTSPVAELSGRRLHNLLPFCFLLTQFRRYVAELKAEFRQKSEQKMKNIQGLCAG